MNCLKPILKGGRQAHGNIKDVNTFFSFFIKYFWIKKNENWVKKNIFSQIENM